MPRRRAVLARVGAVAELAVKAAGLAGRNAPAGLLASSSVSANPSADLLTFSVTDPDPAVAKELATAYATQFTVYRRRLDTGVLSASIADVQRRLAVLAAGGQRGSPLSRQLTGELRDLQSMQTLDASGASAVVVGPAGSTTQVQPRTTRNVALGILVGIALGVGLAFLREAFDTRVRSAAELRARLGLPLLGHLPRPDRSVAEGRRLTRWPSRPARVRRRSGSSGPAWTSAGCSTTWARSLSPARAPARASRRRSRTWR